MELLCTSMLAPAPALACRDGLTEHPPRGHNGRGMSCNIQ